MRLKQICLTTTLLLSSACASAPKTAIVDGREQPRLTLELTGQPYTVKHEGAHPRPGSPSSGLKDDGGIIRGRICGMLVDYDISHRGDRVQAVGSLDNKYESAIDIREDNGLFHITGNLGSLGVDLQLQRGQLTGHVGLRVFALESKEDRLQGWLRENSRIAQAVVPITINGLQALWAMPAADQAVVLSNLLTCGTSWQQHRVFDPVVVGMGGKATDVPPETSAVWRYSGRH